MVKVCLKDFPKGSFKKQISDGFYIEGYLKENLDIFARKIVDDQMFVFLITGSGFVRIGKSVLAQQIGYYLTDKVNELHKTKNKFDLNNIVFKGFELKDKAFALPRYSVIVLDEGDDLVEHYWSKLAKELRRFFRKAGQLNNFIVLVLPDYFELPKNYAITRSMCLINVKYVGKFDRGFYDFYNFEQKKKLYLKGKKDANYKSIPPNFSGRFTNVYTINEQEYRKKKKEDLDEQEEGEEKTTSQITRELTEKYFKNTYYYLTEKLKLKITVEQLTKPFEISRATGYNFLNNKSKF